MSPDLRCLRCGAGELAEGFLASKDTNYERWVAGRLKRGILGGARMSGRSTSVVAAYRCPQCAHLELFAGEDDG